MNDGVVSIRVVARWIVSALIVASVAAGALVVRLTVLSASHLNDAERIQQSENREAFFDCLMWAIRNHYPGNPYSREAVVRALSSIREPVGEIQPTQRAQLLELRATLLSIRSFYQPFYSELNEVNERLTALDSVQ